MLKLSNALANTFPIEQLPVELISFSAFVHNNSVTLKWQTATEVNNYGFEVERASLGTMPGEGQAGHQSQGSWEEIGFIKGHGNSNSVKDYSFVDKSISSGNYLYRLKQIDNDGKFEYSKIAEALFYPDEYILEQNYPNPFNPSTNFKFRIPFYLADEKNLVLVTLIIYDVLGREIATVVNEELSPAEYEFPFSMTGLSSGVYYYTLTAGSYISTKKLMLMK